MPHIDNNCILPELEASLTADWDARVVDYDCERFPFHHWALSKIQQLGYPVDDLRNVHKTVSTDDVYKLTKQLCGATIEPDFRSMALDFVHEVVAVEGRLKAPLGVQRFVNVRIMLPDRPQGIFPFHTGLLYGHGTASRSLWMPLTDVSADEDYTASMQILGIDRSRELIRYAEESKLSIPQMQKLFSAESWALKAKPGKAVFFTQENIHGNFVNVTGKSRVSIDFRVAEARFGDRLARKIPGGYFGMLDEERAALKSLDADEEFHNGKTNVIYLNQATPGTEGAPVHLQRYMVYEYLESHNLNYEFEYFELERMKHLPTLRHAVEELGCNVILYSIYALPEDHDARAQILDAALRNGVVLHFVNEGLRISSDDSRDRIEAVLAFAKYGDYSSSEHATPVNIKRPR